MNTLALLAARLVTDQPPVDGLREPPEALLELLKENKYPLLGLMPHPAWNWFYGTESFKRENDAHEALLSSHESGSSKDIYRHDHKGIICLLGPRTRINKITHGHHIVWKRLLQ